MQTQHKPKQNTRTLWRKPMLLLFLCCVFLFSACTSVVPQASSVPLASASIPATDTTATGATVALLTTEAMAETPYGQAAFEDISRAAGEVGLASGLYRTATADNPALSSTVELAVKGGAEFIVMLGEDLADSARQATLLYPQVSFVLQDMQIQEPLPQNVVQISYSALETGFLAGYIGAFNRMADVGVLFNRDTVQGNQYALAFLLGADAAAEANLAPDENNGESVSDAATDTATPAQDSLSAWVLPLAAEEISPFDAIQPESNTENDTNNEIQPQQAMTDFFESAREPSLLFVGADEWVEPALTIAGDNQGCVALPLVGKMPYTYSSSCVQVQFNAQGLLAQLLNAWQQNNFPGGETALGSVHEGDITLYLPEDAAQPTISSYNLLLQMFTNPSQYPQLAYCLSLQTQEDLPPVASLELEHYTLQTQAPIVLQEPSSSV